MHGFVCALQNISFAQCREDNPGSAIRTDPVPLEAILRAEIAFHVELEAGRALHGAGIFETVVASAFPCRRSRRPHGGGDLVGGRGASCTTRSGPCGILFVEFWNSCREAADSGEVEVRGGKRFLRWRRRVKEELCQPRGLSHVLWSLLHKT